jgi:putative peptidoglycan lipid II flippase
VLAALAPGFTPVLSSILLFAVSGVSIQMLAWATLAGLSLEVVTLGVAMRRAGLPWLPSVRAWWRSSAIRVTAREHLRLMSVAAIGNGSLLADQSAAAMIGAGSVSALNYGTRLVAVLAGVAGGALSTVALPRFSRLAQRGDWTHFRAMLRKYMVAVLAVAFPLAMLIGLAAPDLVRLLFLRGAFTEESAAVVTAVQRISAWQLPVLTVNAMLFRVLSSMQANTVVLRIAAVAFVCHAAGSFVLARYLGVPGVAAAGVVSQSVMLVCLAWSAWALIRSRA